ncbi:nucleotidyltransferase family protein [Falsihalocynthiibacter sp. BN13B15]|uniref:nucleotidyltransferase family protein n=1 Tax=Falsihalocynthiibacter sp. BN13B15 TaxID=3240871 RepID=UPI003510C03E
MSENSPAPYNIDLPPQAEDAGKIPVSISNSVGTDALILSALTGKIDRWPDQSVAPDAEELLERINFHGVAGLLATALEGVQNVPESLTKDLRDKRLQYLFWEDRHRHFIGRAIGILSEVGIRPIIIKGTACAYSVYESAADRIRGDTDILVPFAERIHAGEILVDLGFVRGLTFARTRGASQASYALEEGLGWSHSVDLHWQINNSACLSQLFSWDELFSRSAPLPSLCNAARSPAPVDAILIACFHRLVHLRSPYTVDGHSYYSSDRLIWLADIDLLTKGLTEADWTDLVHRARKKGLARISLSGITAATAAFGTKVPPDVLDALAEPTKVSPVETYLNGKSLTRFKLDVAAQTGVWGKIAFIGEHGFPPASYMRAQFGRGLLPMLYMKRGIQGVGKLFSGGNRPS